jgi:uncharacterized protein YlaN (UPF0358 family)
VPLPSYWSETALATIQDPELRRSIKKTREQTDKDIEELMRVIQVNQDLLPEGCSERSEELRWAAMFTLSRRFGFGFPFEMIIPYIDMFNHQSTKNQADLFHSKLHLADNKIYLYPHDFELIQTWRSDFNS